MAQYEPMDVDSLASEFDDKENSLQHSNVLKTSGTEKGYDELDVSEYNMKLRYSNTPGNSPMSRSYTASYKADSGPNSLNNTIVVDNLTRSLNSTVTKSDILKSPKLPLQALPASLYTNIDRRSCDTEGNVAVGITGTENDDNLSMPSTSSSAVQTPEATTPTKEIPKSDGSPIMRGLKSVLNMFRSSHSPVPPIEDDSSTENIHFNDLDKNGGQSNTQLGLATTSISCNSTPLKDGQSNPLLASTPISSSKLKDTLKRNSPLKDSVVFNDGLERELQWQDESEIYFKHEKIPIHKLLFQTGQLNVDPNTELPRQHNDSTNLNTTVEYMDVSNADISYKSVVENKTLNNFDSRVNNDMSGVESDNEFVDCETTYTQNKSYVLETVQESKTSPVVYQMDNIAHEACLEDYVEPKNGTDNLDKSKILSDDKEICEHVLPKFEEVNELVAETNDLKAETQFDRPKDLSGCSEMVISHVPYTPLQDTNISAEITVLSSELSIEANVNCEDNMNIIKDNPADINIVNIIKNVKSENTSKNALGFDNVYEGLIDTNYINIENNVKTTINNDFQSNVEYSEAMNPSYVQQSVEDKPLQMVVPTNNLVQELDTKNDIKNSNNSEIDVVRNIINPHTSSNIKAEDDFNLDTDDMNTARILFDIDALILNKVNPNYNISNYIENTSEHSKALDNTTIKNNDISKMIDQLDEKTVADEIASADNNNTMDTTDKKETWPVENIKLQNISVNKTFDLETNMHMNVDNSLSLSATEKIITEMEYGLNFVNNVVNPEMVFDFDEDKINTKIGFDLKNSDDHQDITMDSLELNVHQPPCKTITNIQNELKNDPLTIFPLPLDVPLPNDDDNERDNSLDPWSIKNNNEVGVISEIETVKNPSIKNKSTSDCKETINPQMLTKRISKTPHIEVIDIHDEMQSNSHVEMAPICSYIIQETRCSQLSTNLASCLQELHVGSITDEEQPIAALPNETSTVNDTFTGSNIVNQLQINVDFIPTETKLPDVVQTVNDTPEIYDTNNYEIKVKNTNDTLCLGDNTKTDLIDEEILTSANNSPYVSVTELVLNSTSSGPVKEHDNLILSQTKTISSPPISPKCTSKGYNINFDEIENPFTTKTNVRMSPPPEEVIIKTCSPVKNNPKKEIIVQRRPPIRRMSQQDGKNSDMNKKRLNRSLDRVNLGNSNSKTEESRMSVVNTEDNKTDHDKNLYDMTPMTSNENLQKDIINEGDCEHYETVSKISQGIDNATEFQKCKTSNEKTLEKEIISEGNCEHYGTVPKISPGLDNTAEFSKCNETIGILEPNLNKDNSISRSVFNIPEIDDMNFNPFATKSRVCSSPPPTIGAKDLSMVVNNAEVITESKNINATVCTEHSVQNEVKVSPINSNTTSSSINTDKDVTVREVNTEDEDTIEGPFFEAEDLDDVSKLPNIPLEKDAIQFEDVPASTYNKDIGEQKGELFIDAEAFEFLLNQNKSNVVADSGKESLFLKFDPLFAKRVSSDGVLAALSSIQKRQSTPKKMTRAPLVNLAQQETYMMPTAGPSNVASIPEDSGTEIISTISKPMMVVNPAVAKQPVATPRISLTPRTNRHSLNFMSPAMVVIDRLLSLSANTSLTDEGVTTAAASRNHDANMVLIQLRELLGEKELHVHNLKSESKELKERLTSLESQVKSLENEGEERLKKVNNLNQRLTEQTKCNRSMALVVEEYERTIATLIAELEQEKKRNAEERIRLICERDEQTAHLASMEGSFSDLNSKYEKCKQIILSMKANEDAYKKSLKEFDENLLKMQKNYDLLKQHATSKLNHANQELEKMNKAHDADVLKLNAMIKRKELHITSLEESLSQKKKAIEELTEICDELINKVG
ncbi:jg27002 [Pararge aegeria aegeria]|uniref:Jg27002 protein n=1 Tax=Pararge aegeria aegeria TaxID=348720 RepID=A0A8S4RTF7_9NEOP|nr:jg27002 [Pararge aegeria aegeria]